MRALVLTTMYPRPERPAHGVFVRDQVRALARLPGLEVELFTFASEGARAYVAAARELRRRYRGTAFDVVHAHFGLTAWPALALSGGTEGASAGPAGSLAKRAPHGVTLHGTDLAHPRSRAITLGALPFLDLVAPVSEELATKVPRRLVRGHMEVLPCGVDTDRFHPIDRLEARRAVGLDPHARYLLFPSDPVRPEKRYDRAQAVAQQFPLLTLRDVDPDQVPLWVNAADAVLIPSEREGFGLAVLEALACDVPVLATPVGIAPAVLAGIQGAWCAPFSQTEWREALASVLAAPDPRIHGRAAAQTYSAGRMAERLLDAWHRMV